MPRNLSPRAALLTAAMLGLGGGLAGCGGDGGSGSGTTLTSAATAPATSRAGQRMGPNGMPSYPPVTPGPAATGAHNDADVAFARDMIPHHGQAVQMADIILTRGEDAHVTSLAKAIKEAQAPEIATMSGWLKGWGATPPDPYGHALGMPGMNHGGMMSAEQMQQLAQAEGAAADKAFLTMMIKHHEGAVQMARAEVTQGVNPQAKHLAQEIISSQQAEIDQMKRLLTTLT